MSSAVLLLLLHYGYATLETDPLVVSFNKMAEELQRGQFEKATEDVSAFDEQLRIAKESFHLDLRPRFATAIQQRETVAAVEVLATLVETAIREKFRVSLEERLKDPALVMPRVALARSYYKYFLAGNPMDNDRRKGTTYHNRILHLFDVTVSIASHVTGREATDKELADFKVASDQIHGLLLEVYPFLSRPGKPAPE